MHTPVGRFAPTPSGPLHMGNVFSLLIAWLRARQAGGIVRMRIEDLDTARTSPAFANQIMHDLAWLGLTWDGDVLYQSKRSEAYRSALEALKAKGLVYPCFCSRADLHAADAPHVGDEYIYKGTCRNLSAAQREARLLERPAALRVTVGQSAFSFQDVFQGQHSYQLAHCSGDFIIQRSDKVFAYQLAVVVDDAYQNVNDVVRGIDLIASSARQLFLQEALGLPHPTYAHIPLVVNADGTRLSKRTGSTSLAYYIEEKRWTADRVLGHLAYVAGLIEHDENMGAEELVNYADLSALCGKHAIYWDE